MFEVLHNYSTQEPNAFVHFLRNLPFYFPLDDSKCTLHFLIIPPMDCPPWIAQRGSIQRNIMGSSNWAPRCAYEDDSGVRCSYLEQRLTPFHLMAQVQVF